jgi:hypothetical protein
MPDTIVTTCTRISAIVSLVHNVNCCCLMVYANLNDRSKYAKGHNCEPSEDNPFQRDVSRSTKTNGFLL